MTSLAVLLLVGLTSLGAYAVGTRWLRLPPASLRQAGARALDCAGLTVIFLVANVTLGVALILGLRAVTGQFVSAYLINDASLAVLSLAQAVFFRWWRELPH